MLTDLDTRIVDRATLEAVAAAGGTTLERIPYVMRIVLENLVRNRARSDVSQDALTKAVQWAQHTGAVVPIYPGRIVMPDSSGIPALLDLASLRSEVVRRGIAPEALQPLLPMDVIVDHSLQVDESGTSDAFEVNQLHEFRRNSERYRFLRWATQAFGGVRVFPPGSGIVHQINLEYLSEVVHSGPTGTYPEFMLGADSHTPMINGLGVLGWGVGGLEIISVLLGQPYMLSLPKVIGVKLIGNWAPGATSTDLVLAATAVLREHGVVGNFVEFFGPSLPQLSVQDRATVSNMSPESGATATYFPIDQATLDYLLATGRSTEHVTVVENYCRAAGLFSTSDASDPEYDAVIVIDLSTLSPYISGPSKPQQRHTLDVVGEDFRRRLASEWQRNERNGGKDAESELTDGSIVVAAIASCTNTSNPKVMLAAGLLARKAVEYGLTPHPLVKTSMTPGSRNVTRYLEHFDLMEPLEALGFGVAGYGCATCGGKSGPLLPEALNELQDSDIVATAVLSGNRNFPGRIHRYVRASYLASPPLVIAYAIAGRIDVDLTTEPVGLDSKGNPVFLTDLWPDESELEMLVKELKDTPLVMEPIDRMLEGTELWRHLKAPTGPAFEWDPESTYMLESSLVKERHFPQALTGARALGVYGDGLTTDHISPSGEIPPETDAGKYLQEHGIKPENFNTYVGRRGNHHVMVRGTFANIRIRNLLTPGLEGGFTRKYPEETIETIFTAAQAYEKEGTPLLVFGGTEYGTGSSRDWAAKGTALLGVRAVVAKSFERIHRSNLVAMGILPLKFADGEGWEELGLKGDARFDIPAFGQAVRTLEDLEVIATMSNGTKIPFKLTPQVFGEVERKWLKEGGVLPLALKNAIAEWKNKEIS